MKPRNSCERSSSRSSKDAARHSSPILRSMQLSSHDSRDNSGSCDQQRLAKLNANRSSNSSDISVPGQSLHTDSGISSFDSLAGGERRSQSPDLVAELLKIADVKLSEICRKDDLSRYKENTSLQSSNQSAPLSTSAANHVVLPVLGSMECEITDSMSSIFMTSMDAAIPAPDPHDYCDNGQTENHLGKYNSNLFRTKSRDIDRNDARLYCSACGDILNDPRLLPCLHTFCTDCLQTRVVHKHTNDAFSLEGLSASKIPDFSSETLACPTCSANLDLPLEGVHALPINHMIQRLLILHNLHTGRENEVTCDLCPDRSTIEARCIQCRVNMCEFCLQAHKRQSLTSTHSVVKVDEIDCGAHGFSLDNLKKHLVPMMCQRHTSEELRLFCLDCSQLVCRDCCLGSKHKDHRCEYLNHVIDRKTSEISSEFRVCESKIKALVRTISCLEKSEQTIDDTAEEVAGKIERHIESYIRSLQKHKNALLASVNTKAKAKKDAVQVQKESLTKILKDMSHSCDFTSQLLNLGNQHEILSMKPYVLKRLQELSQVSFAEDPNSMENFVEFKANKKVKTWIDGDTISCLAENKRSSKLLRPGLEVDICGDVISHSLETAKCTAHGEGIYCTRVKLPSEFVVIAKNFEGEKLEAGGHDVSVSLEMEGIDPNLFKKPKIQVADKQDGTYRILYIVYATGTYKLSACIEGDHICGSPFRVSAVDSKSHVHSGIFHCCCFCSSGGDKDSTCACGAVMPGGYKGCGHGQKGHPGQAHWSCCGKTTENSPCGKHAPPSRFDITRHGKAGVPSQYQAIHQSQTLPMRHMVPRDIFHQASGSPDELYVTPATLRSQRAGAFEPAQYFTNRQHNAQTLSTKQVKTVTL